MQYVIKTAPMDDSPSSSLRFCERPMYGGGKIRAGDEVFVWYSETQGGGGLSWSGRVDRVEREHRRLCVTASRIKSVTESFGIANLEPYRWSDEGKFVADDGSPLSELCRKLYTHSHNKVAALTTEEARVLDDCLG